MIQIDIHTKHVGSDTRIFVVRPGGKYRFYKAFIDSNFVAPDLPGLDLPEFERIEEVKDLDARVNRSIAIRKNWLKSQDADEDLSYELEDYEAGSSRALSQFIRVASAYFGEMKQGDLVIVPPMAFRGRAEIGELTSAPNIIRRMRVDIYGGDALMGRNVKWLASLEKSNLPAQTLDALQKPSPLFLLPRPAWASVFRRAYGSYTTDNEFGARFEITSDSYQTTDDFRIQAFFNFVAANTERVRRGEKGVLSLRDGAFSAEGVAPDLFTNVNSPGGLSLKSLVSTPIVIAVMLTLAVTVGPAAHSAAVNGQLKFGNSLAAANDPCVVEVDKQVVTQLTLLGYDRWAEACEIARSAAERTGITTTVEVKK
ncbi:hypothetical protein ABIA24_003376 [Sinorhizobium fredii]|uniref:hypothetical protein n=1 Tax=Rhizobium fredii TaxID=380 RepID=UPI003513D924